MSTRASTVDAVKGKKAAAAAVVIVAITRARKSIRSTTLTSTTLPSMHEGKPTIPRQRLVVAVVQARADVSARLSRRH